MPWYINEDLKSLVELSRSIVGPNHSEYCYAPSNPRESDNAPYPLTSGADVTTAIVKVNGLLFGRFHTISHTKHGPPTSPFLAVKTKIVKEKDKIEVLDEVNLQKVLDELGLGTVSEKEATAILENVRFKNGGVKQWRSDMKSYKEDVDLYESKQAAMLQRHPYAEGNLGGYHAEDAFLSAWTEFKKAKIYQEIKDAGKGQLYVSLKLSKTPCEKCTPRLIKFVTEEKEVKLRIKAQKVYFDGTTLGVGVQRMQQLINAGIPVKSWSLEERVGKKKLTKEGQLHELSFWDFNPLDAFEGTFLKDLKEKLVANTKQIESQFKEEKIDAVKAYKAASRHSPNLEKIVF